MIHDVARSEPYGPPSPAAEDVPTEKEGARAARTVKADARHRAVLRGSEGAERFDVGSGGVIGRDDDVEFHLDHPHVSRADASLTVDGVVVIADLGSSNGTFVNGRPLAAAVSLVAGDRIDIGPFSLQFDGVGGSPAGRGQTTSSWPLRASGAWYRTAPPASDRAARRCQPGRSSP